MKLLIALTSHAQLGTTGRQTGFYLSELTHALEVFEAAEVEIDLASPKGGKPPMDGVDRADPANQRFLDDASWQERLANTQRLSDVDSAEYDAVYVPGGHGTMFDLPEDGALQSLLANVYEEGGVVSAVCHGPAALVNVKLDDGRYLVAGREVAAFTNEEEAEVKLSEAVPFLLESKLVERGATFISAPKFQAHVAVSDRLVTGQNPASARDVAVETLRLLGHTF
jgi:putative intracellular protease/amidase